LFPSQIAPNQATITIKQLAAYPLIAAPVGTSARAAHDRLFANASAAPNVVLQCANQETLVGLVRRGVGVALTAGAYAGSEHDGIAAIGLRDQAPAVLVLVHRAKELSAAAHAFAQIATSSRPTRSART
jgi:DNA-binding transcriptional LysR family regulator